MASSLLSTVSSSTSAPAAVTAASLSSTPPCSFGPAHARDTKLISPSSEICSASCPIYTSFAFKHIFQLILPTVHVKFSQSNHFLFYAFLKRAVNLHRDRPTLLLFSSRSHSCCPCGRSQGNPASEEDSYRRCCDYLLKPRPVHSRSRHLPAPHPPDSRSRRLNRSNCVQCCCRF